MKKVLFTLAMMLTTLTASAMSYKQAREQALFLTDKMAYELDLTEEQYEAAYEVNLDYLMSITTASDVYSDYWTRRPLIYPLRLAVPHILRTGVFLPPDILGSRRMALPHLRILSTHPLLLRPPGMFLLIPRSTRMAHKRRALMVQGPPLRTPRLRHERRMGPRGIPQDVAGMALQRRQPPWLRPQLTPTRLP